MDVRVHRLAGTLQSRAALALGFVALTGVSPATSVVASPTSQPVQPAPFVRWAPSVDAPLSRPQPPDVVGAVEQPVSGSTAGPGGIAVSGWVVDRFSAERPDRVEVYDGPHAGGRLVLVAQPFVWRNDVADLFGSSAYKASGFTGTIAPGALAAGSHTLTVAAHFEWIGWWTTTLSLTINPEPAVDSTAPPPTNQDPAPPLSADQ